MNTDRPPSRVRPSRDVTAKHAKATELLGQAWSTIENEVSQQARSKALELASAAAAILREMGER